MKHVSFHRDTAEHPSIAANHAGRIKTGLIVTLSAMAITAALAGLWGTGRTQAATPMTFTVTNTNDSGAGSLRQAILDANSNPGADTINFNILGSGVQTITPTLANPLPPITDPVVIDGYTQPSASSNTMAESDNAVILIEISGAIVSNNGDALLIANGGRGSTVRGLAIDRGWSAGILITDSSNNVIEGCFLGTDASGLIAHGNGNGVLIETGGNSSNNLIGGTTPAARNVISGNNTGVFIRGGSGTNNMVQGNFIGTDKTGAVVLTGQAGVNIRSSDNLIGGSTVAARNIIAGNGNGTGVTIDIDLSVPTGNLIQGNFIGTDVTGTIALGFSSGVSLLSSTSNTQVGGPTATPGTPPGNVISGNSTGISFGNGSSDNTIQGNLIGTNATGTTALGNLLDGIFITGASNVIGGSAANVGNVISANGGHGLNIGTDNASVHDNLVQGNFIGTDITGSNQLGNGGNGINVTTAFTNPILGNRIAFNAGLGIDLNGDGLTMNDHCDGDGGANNLQNYPDLTSASSSSGTTTVTGTLDSIANTTFRIEFFSNASCDSSGHGEGLTFLGSTDVITDGNCTAPINAMVSGNLGGQFITATATRLDTSTVPATRTDTSEFSACVLVSGTSGGCTVSCPQDQVVTSDPNQCGATVNYPAPDTTGTCGTVACTPAAGTFFPKGTTTVNCSEPGGSACAFTVTVNDAQEPALTCPGNIAQGTDPNQCTAAVNYSTTANDNCDGALTPTCSPPPGSAFQKGTTTVTCSATDTSGNTATCSFEVTVNDNQPPNITCPNNINASATGCAIVTYSNPAVSDNCPGVGIPTCNPPSGTCFPQGTTTVSCSVTDASSNSNNCSFTVTVASCTSITCPANITQPNDPNQCGAFVTYPAPTSSGGCEPVICSPASGSFFPVGTSTVICTSSAGPTCTFTVTVKDMQPPAITCPANVMAVSAVACPPTNSTAVTFPTPTASDNCPGVTVLCVPPSGSTLPAGTTTVTCTATDASGNTASCSFTVTSFNGRLQDDSNPKTVLLFNTTTGDYVLCCGGMMLSGKGIAVLKGCSFTLQHYATDRRLLANVDFASKRGSASLQFPPGVTKCTITDRNMMDDTSSCP